MKTHYKALMGKLNIVFDIIYLLDGGLLDAN